MRYRARNGNWKGGISLFKSADDLLLLSESAKADVLSRLISSIEVLPDCWEWTGKVFNNGRPRISLGRNNHIASRLMYVLYFGVTGGLCVLHSCDNITCMNPDHFFLGTNADNSSDMTVKGRQAWGERNGGAILSENQVRELRKDMAGKKLYGKRKALATKYGVGEESISRALSGETWRKLDDQS